MRSLIRVLVSAFALWLTTLIVGGSGENGVWIRPISDDPLDPTADYRFGYIVTLILVALVFGLVNGTLGKVVRFVSIPLYIITLGLFGLIVNGLMFAVVAWLSDLAGFGLVVDGFWWGVLAALVMSVLSGLMNALLGTGKRRDRD
ncbi:phage holin family protein [Leucobacter sp. CSA1]|uniref:Phage holin family protein n=1 Tax=Leucobacter chromiisoli TaxID=2796471 RepID=A0A934UUR3_9MICO|nr:phage holin family protein [Leucobacter chromiisoli]MBK0418701.1 phage holin family protein [Leucobacter chromiisoli]